MIEKYQLAKNQGLNWQAIIIEDLQEWIKLKVRNMLIEGYNYEQIRNIVVKHIEEQTIEFENKELKERTRIGMEQLLKRTYAYLYSVFKGIGWAVLGAIANVASQKDKADVTKKVKVVKKGKYPVELEKDKKIIGYFMETKGIYKHAVPITTFASDYMRRVSNTLGFLTEIEAKDIYGERVSLRNIAEMTVRHDRQVNNLLQLKRDNVKLVYIQPHANCSERCEPWQGKVYSLDGSSGITPKGVRYQPLENATDIYVTTKAGRTYKNGCISGFNCLHKLLPYEDGMQIVEIPAKVVETERKISQTQRYMERLVRKYRQNALQMQGINDRLYLINKQKAIEANKRYIKFSQDNKVPYYPSRTEILENE